MGQVEDEEIRKAMRYREQWNNRIAFRANQLHQLAGSRQAFQTLWDKYQKIYSRTAYIPGEEEQEFFTPWDTNSDAGGVSRSYVELPNTKQSRRVMP